MTVRKREGFTLIEMVVVVTIIGILVNIAIPATQTAKRKAIAAGAVADVRVIRSALLDYYADNQDLPANSAWGTVPPELVDALPNGFEFRQEHVMYRWRRNGARRQRRTGELGIVKIRVLSRDNELALAMQGLFNGRTSGSRRTLNLVIE